MNFPHNVVSQDYTAWNLGQALTCKQVDDRREATSNHHVTTKTNKFIANDHFFLAGLKNLRVKFQSFLSQGYWSCFSHWGNVLCFSLLWRSQLHDEGQVHPQFLMGNAFESQDVISSCQAVQQHGIALRYGSEEIRWTLSGNNWVFVKHKAAVTKTEISTSPWHFIWPRFWSGFGICRGGYPKNWTKNRWSWHMRITFLEFWGFSL